MLSPSSTAEPGLTLSGGLARECVQALAAGLSEAARVELLRGMLTNEERVEAWTDLLRAHSLLTLEDATALTPWTESGFKRVASRENLPWIKGPHMARRTDRFAEVAAMLTRLQVWPKGQPATVAFAAA